MSDATECKLIVGIVLATRVALAIVIADLATGGRPDPPTLRATATLLDGRGDSIPSMPRTGRMPLQAIAAGSDRSDRLAGMTAT